ncbi:transposase [Thermaerobacillus caldiproteolyticus]|uniref:transposase n=1 Tax=Thermaerobacillus caldiproteolyticus TaxID=247480 RepID=UPI00280B9E75|nr:transposase [Anoxybacillus caldiproteolyticus]
MRKQAETCLTQWLDLYLFSNFAASIATRCCFSEEVLSCVVFPYLNRVMEGTNNKIKLIKRRGLGYRNIQRFTLRVRLAPYTTV